MQIDKLSWFPGHMTKTIRMIEDELKNIDAVCEIVDARIPMSSRNPDINRLVTQKPRIMVLNRIDQADMVETKKWEKFFTNLGYHVILCDAKSGKGTRDFSKCVKDVLREKLNAYFSKGQVGRVLRVMVLGIPNVGKSTFINRVANKKIAKAEDRPGVTRSKQWVVVDNNLELLDTPGVLWPKFDDPKVGIKLAFTGAIKDDVIEIEELASYLAEYLSKHYPKQLYDRYHIELSDKYSGYDVLEKIARKRGFLIRGGDFDLERVSRILLDEYRGGKLGLISLEVVEEFE